MAVLLALGFSISTPAFSQYPGYRQLWSGYATITNNGGGTTYFRVDTNGVVQVPAAPAIGAVLSSPQKSRSVVAMAICRTPGCRH